MARKEERKDGNRAPGNNGVYFYYTILLFLFPDSDSGEGQVGWSRGRHNNIYSKEKRKEKKRGRIIFHGREASSGAAKLRGREKCKCS